MIHGAWLIHKPASGTSNSLLQKCKRILLQKGWIHSTTKIGHAGTLDPFASGLLVLLTGEATKLSDLYLHSKKTYTGTLKLGIKTDTADYTGQILETKIVPPHSLEEWQTYADQFIHDPYFQTPPMYSAKKLDGKALYTYARQGKTLVREPILKKIDQFQILNFNPTPSQSPELDFEVTCESGTYVRTLAEDFAQKAGTVAHLTRLHRTKSSDLHVEQSATLEELEKAPLPHFFIPLEKLGTHVTSLFVDSKTAHYLRNGNTKYLQSLLVQASELPSSTPHVLVRVSDSTVSDATVGNSALNAPVALLEKKPDFTFRLQRIILSL